MGYGVRAPGNSSERYVAKGELKMILNKLILNNFRSYKEKTEINISDLNVLIGRNDIGKSSILEALDIFFNSKPVKEDLAIEHDNSIIEICCVFEDYPDEIILDDSTPTSLFSEFLLNAENKIEIIKRFSVSGSGTISEEAFIKCEYPENRQLEKLLSMKRTALKNKCEQLQIDTSSINKNKNSELRQAIRNHYYADGNIQTETKEIKIDGKIDNEDNLKKIWSSLEKYLPLFSLFFVDKPLNDQDSDIQEPMKDIIKEVLKRDDIAKLLDRLKSEVMEASTSMADKTIKKLNEIESSLAETLRSNFPKEPSWNTIFKLTLEDNRGIPLNKRGSGMRRLVLLSFFRAQIENRRTENAPNIIYALEEPETSQHPDFQLMVVNALIELSNTDNAQVIFTTHNSNLAKEIPLSSLKYLYQSDNSIIIENGVDENGVENKKVLDKIVNTLGALPDPKNKVAVLIFVEGENDINALINYSILINQEEDDVINLNNNESIAFIPTGGSQLKYYIEKKYLDGLLQAQVHIYDSDIEDYVQAVRTINEQNDPKKHGFNTIKLEIENYLHPEAIVECYKEHGIDIDIEEILDTDDVPKKIAKAVHEKTSETDWTSISSDPVKTAEKQKKKISQAKKLLNTKAIEKMTISRLKTKNGYDEIKSWLKKIEELVMAT